MMCHAGFGGIDPLTNELLTASSRRSAAATAGRYSSDGPDAVQAHGQKHRETRPSRETELNYPVRVTRLSLVEDSDGAGAVPRRARACARTSSSTAPRRSPCWADRTPSRGPSGGARRARRQGRGVRADPRRRRDAAAGEDDARGAAGRHDQLPNMWRRWLRPSGGGAIRSASPATCARARSAPSEHARCMDGRHRPDHVRGDPQRARRRNGRDGACPQAQRVLDKHQDAVRLLLRVLRRAICAASHRASPSRCTSARWSSRFRRRCSRTVRRTSRRAT